MYCLSGKLTPNLAANTMTDRAKTWLHLFFIDTDLKRPCQFYEGHRHQAQFLRPAEALP